MAKDESAGKNEGIKTEDEKKKKIKTAKKIFDFDELELKQYYELLEMKEKVDKKLKPLKLYLEKAGLLSKAVSKKKI